MKESDHDIINVTPLKRFHLKEGDVLHGLKANEKQYYGFEEAYFSFIKSGRIKAWKRHLKMTMNIIVPIGSVLFNFYDKSEKEIMVITIGEKNYSRITVPPKIWFGFKGLGKKDSLVLNISNIIHDPKEVEKKDLNYLSFKELKN